MSLLLEALKKAELAKQGKKPADDDASEQAIAFEPAPPAPEREAQPRLQPVITRGELPDISQPLEILSEDLPSASAKRVADEAASQPMAAEPMAAEIAQPTPAPSGRPPRMVALETEPEPDLEPAAESNSTAPPASRASQDAVGAADRDAARQLFEAKEVEFHPKRNFYITVGVLLSAGAGYAGYVWWQLQPKTFSTVATQQGAAKGPPAAPASPVPVPPPQVTPAAAQGQQAPATASPGSPTGAAKAAATGAPVDSQPPGAKAGPVFARSGGPAASSAAPDRPAARSSAQGPARGEQSPITIMPPALAVDPLVERAFQSYQQGDLAGAREAYQQALAREPFNRDALLGLAAIDVRARSFDSAETRYIRILELDPRDIQAVAGLMSLRGQADPGQSESRLKSLIASNPDAAGLYFPLGNLYAQQSRWSEAQAAYFKAYAGDSENADFAFNLAVSLDQLRQKPLALQYYHRALALAANRPVSFDVNQILARLKELERP